MITFYSDKTTVDGRDQWIEITSTYADYVVFSMGEERPGPRFSDDDPIAVHSISGKQLLDLKHFSDTGVKSDWMGKPAGPFTSGTHEDTGSKGEMQLLDFERVEDEIVILMGRYFSDRESSEGHFFSYPMKSIDFSEMVKRIVPLLFSEGIIE